jgi:phosphoribosyl 1,2-cyclic phosphodiesterase
MKIRVLGSSSAGNCSVVWDGARGILIDCGLSFRYISTHLHALGLSWNSIAGVLITHAHGDHVHPRTTHAAIEMGIPLFSPPPVVEAITKELPSLRKALSQGRVRPLESRSFSIGPFDVTAFEVPHDSQGGCFGYQVFESNLLRQAKLTLATDMGFAEDGLSGHFADSDVVVVESNHDEEMLENSGRPPWLKQRIKSIGHLSNGQCARFLIDVIERSSVKPHAVMLAHISQQCNTNALAVRCTNDALMQRGHQNIRVLETFRARPSEIVTI